MFFKRRKSLKKEFDRKLLLEMELLKQNWRSEKEIYERSYKSNPDLEMQVKLAEIKYFYLIKEAKKRDIRISANLFK